MSRLVHSSNLFAGMAAHWRKVRPAGAKGSAVPSARKHGPAGRCQFDLAARRHGRATNGGWWRLPRRPPEAGADVLKLT
ncbi:MULTISPECIES: hypothetical protein [unclassified Pseudofrankia]|uniref:hypothetical protein n=1 Tax=unclassified Pseudofrankia TaxID=2994372 RepID=UPI0008DADCA4|nr:MULTISPECIES: hypothetical protein [unclassified Pseudofrankia]MDT3442497.1 hypothetical protein [Pseudofrankia sp. BMG5.37]OHV74712.1 hypothetical protein BCD48_31710 [Pseudofrankia sp. BMG5.36]